MPSLPKYRNHGQESDREWDYRDEAACRNHPDPEIFFPVVRSNAYVGRTLAVQRANEQALAVCAGCPERNRAACLAEALDLGAEGIWGNTTEEQRRKLPKTKTKVKAEPKPVVKVKVEGPRACAKCGLPVVRPNMPRAVVCGSCLVDPRPLRSGRAKAGVR